MMILKNECPCINCKFHTYGDSITGLHYCRRLHRSISQHNGNTCHHAGQWIIPCGRDMNLFKSKENK